MRLPLCRFRQIVELIQQRHIEALRVQARMIEWQTKQLAAVIASTTDLTPKGQRQLAQQIREMTLIPDDLAPTAKPLTSEEEIADIVENGSKTAADDPRNAAAIMWLESALAS